MRIHESLKTNILHLLPVFLLPAVSHSQDINLANAHQSKGSSLSLSSLHKIQMLVLESQSEDPSVLEKLESSFSTYEINNSMMEAIFQSDKKVKTPTFYINEDPSDLIGAAWEKIDTANIEFENYLNRSLRESGIETKNNYFLGFSATYQIPQVSDLSLRLFLSFYGAGKEGRDGRGTEADFKSGPSAFEIKYRFP